MKDNKATLQQLKSVKDDLHKQFVQHDMALKHIYNNYQKRRSKAACEKLAAQIAAVEFAIGYISVSP